MSEEMGYYNFKIANHVREYEEKRVSERKRQLLYLILHYLREEGFYETAQSFSNEAHLSNQYEVCDNIDLSTIVQDFETYYYVRFQKYPKICKKVVSEENKKNIWKKPVLAEKIHHTTKVRRNSIQNGENKLQVPASKSSQKTSSNNSQKSFKSNNSLPELDLIVLPLTSGDSNQGNNAQNDTQENGSEKFLKPLSGCHIYNAEWKEFAEIISKEICVNDLNVHWNDIMGLDEAKQLLKEAVVYPTKYPELFSGVLAPWKSLLLYGPPGTGKTLLAKAVATESRTTFFNIAVSSIISKWRGDSEKLVRVMFELARYHAPSTIFLDELDALASHRDTCGTHEGSRRLKAELFIQLDGLTHSEDRVFLLATSNLPWELDTAILRRLEKRILVDLPNTEARRSMIEHYLPPVVTKGPSLLSKLDYELLAHESAGYSGSDIKLVCKETAMNAVREAFSVLETHKDDENVTNLKLKVINTEDLQNALRSTKPSAAHLAPRYHKWHREFGST